MGNVDDHRLDQDFQLDQNHQHSSWLHQNLVDLDQKLNFNENVIHLDENLQLDQNHIYHVETDNN